MNGIYKKDYNGTTVQQYKKKNLIFERIPEANSIDTYSIV